jgi:acyl-coenzyme A synthetase/AMP-(fatty) acid ligase
MKLVIENAELQPFRYLQHWSALTPEAPFFRDGKNEISFAEALNSAQRLSSELQRLGLREGDVIALDMSVALQVIFIAAAAQLRLVTCSHLEYNATTSGFRADWLFSSNRSTSASARQVVVVDGAFLRGVQSAHPLDVITDYSSLESTYRIAFSSGSTGLPKAVPLTLDMVHHRALAAAELVIDGTPFMSILDVTTASGFHTLHDGWMRGACYYNPGDAKHNVAQIRNFGITAIKTSPVQLAELCDAATHNDANLDPLQRVYSAGSLVPVALRHKFRSLSAARLFTLYGSTEAGRCAERELTDDDLSNVGPIAPGSEVRTVDAAGTEVAIGTSGQIHYRRAHQATHYLGDEAASTNAFRDGWFVTGDLGHLTDDGELVLEGRANDIVNAGGIKVNLHEIEVAALRVGKLADAAAVVIDDIDGVHRVVLAVVRGPSSDLETLGRDLKNQFGALAPHTVLGMPTIPKNRAGKTDRDALGRVVREALSPKT